MGGTGHTPKVPKVKKCLDQTRSGTHILGGRQRSAVSLIAPVQAISLVVTDPRPRDTSLGILAGVLVRLVAELLEWLVGCSERNEELNNFELNGYCIPTTAAAAALRGKAPPTLPPAAYV